MIDAKSFCQYLYSKDLNFFTGVPDSILKNFTAELKNDLLKPNEGSAVAAACGYHLATNKIPVVYMQNSGLGNAINPLATFALVYRIPILLFVGWRGEDKDEPQHEVMGRSSAKILEALGIDYDVLSIDQEKAQSQILNSLDRMKTQEAPFAFLVRQKTFKDSPKEEVRQEGFNRAEIIEELLDKLNPEDKVFATVGYTGRELYKHAQGREKLHQVFIGTGAMGHISQIALEFSKANHGNTYCLDGDGSAIMHLGNLIEMSKLAPKNLKYIIFNNSSHQSVGYEKSLWEPGEIGKFFKNLGIKPVDALDKLINSRNFSVWEALCNLETLDSLPRPKENPRELKKIFLDDKTSGTKKTTL